MILQTIEKYYTWGLIAILLLNLAQRKIPNSSKKRFATIYLAALLLLFEIGVVTILSRDLNHNFAWLVLAVVIGIFFIFRKRTFPFRFRCADCNKTLDFNHIIGHDDNLCQECYYKAHPEEAAKKEEEEKQRAIEEKEDDSDSWKDALTVNDINWDLWEAKEVCVITYLFKDDQVLLIDKKTGLGRGLVNAPGGHIEETETALEAAKREFTEETGLSVDDLKMVGTLNFQFRDGLSERGYVYFAYAHEGDMVETEEARPFWCPVSEIPYDKMWEDDIHWLPLALEGKKFEGSFIFDDQKMVDKVITIEEDNEEE